MNQVLGENVIDKYQAAEYGKSQQHDAGMDGGEKDLLHGDEGRQGLPESGFLTSSIAQGREQPGGDEVADEDGNAKHRVRQIGRRIRRKPDDVISTGPLEGIAGRPERYNPRPDA